ncbi:MAG: hypothetical protein JKX84_06280 [Flavobacteriales bacterium]|nr:hypothetical protein [Flavobacteriales bacterium]
MKYIALLIIIGLTNTTVAQVAEGQNYITDYMGIIMPFKYIEYGRIDTVRSEKYNRLYIEYYDAEGNLRREDLSTLDGIPISIDYSDADGRYEGFNLHWENGHLDNIALCQNDRCFFIRFNRKGRIWEVTGDAANMPRGMATVYYDNGLVKMQHNRNKTIDTAYFYYKDGALWKKGEANMFGAPVGNWKEYYRNGILKSEKNIAYQKKDDWLISNHHDTIYDPRFIFTNEGVWNFYSESGELIRRETWKLDSLLRVDEY